MAFFKKWGVTLYYCLFVINWLFLFCVVFWFVVCTPCTPNFSAECGERVRGIAVLHIFRKWGVTLYYLLFVIDCLFVVCVVFGLVVCTPCTPFTPHGF